MPVFKIDLDVEEVKACLSEMEDVKEWIENAIKNKARKVMDRILEAYFSGKVEQESEFTPEEQQQIDDAIGKRYLTSEKVKRLPPGIKKLIVKRLKLSTPEERKAEYEKKERR